MSKAFVIKNKEGKYPDDTQFQPFFTTKDICKTTLYKNFEEAQKARRSEFYKVVEITIAEGDLLQKIAELKDYICSYNNEINNRPQICNEYIDATCKDILEKMKELKL